MLFVIKTKKTVKCNTCYSSIVCSDCLLSMCESGLADKCPICRTKQWIQKKVDYKGSTKIAPANINTSEPTISKCKKCKLFCKKTFQNNFFNQKLYYLYA